MFLQVRTYSQGLPMGSELLSVAAVLSNQQNKTKSAKQNMCSLSFVTSIEVVDRAVQLDSASLIAKINIVTISPNSSLSM